MISREAFHLLKSKMCVLETLIGTFSFHISLFPPDRAFRGLVEYGLQNGIQDEWCYWICCRLCIVCIVGWYVVLAAFLLYNSQCNTRFSCNLLSYWCKLVSCHINDWQEFCYIFPVKCSIGDIRLSMRRPFGML